MTEMATVDARGLSCPQPAMMARQTVLKLGAGVIEVLVDTSTARDNCARMAQSNGWSVEIEERPDGEFRLVLRK